MKRLYNLLPLPGLLLLAGTVVILPVQAQQESDPGQGRGVARLSLMNGDVSIQRGDSGDWVAAAVNAPLLAEDRIAVGPASRAEVQFDYHHRVRIAPDAQVRLAELEWRQYLLQVAGGTVTFTALPGGDAQVEISTPGAAVRPVAHGNYRVTVLPDGTAEITVRAGEAEIFTPRGSQRLRAGRTMLVRPDPNGGPEFTMVAAIARDAWDEFNDARDRDLRRGEHVYQSYVSRDIYGAEDLHGHGTWVHVPPYGMVWRPFVAAGWAPYTMGRWTWLDWYGWSWVSYDPWGWAPYHYGRWFMHAGNWCWFPGAFGGRHFWSPGLVGWVGFGGPNWGIGLGFGRLGWVPLAPFEPFHPWWGHGFYGGFRGGNFIQNNMTVVNNTNVTNIYRNARIGNAVTVVNGEDFRRGNFGRSARASADDLRSAHLVRGAVPVGPERDSLRYSDRAANPSTAARAAAGSERFYTRREVTPVDRVPFEQQRSAFTRGESGGGRQEMASGRSAGTERGGERGADAGGSTGWRRFGDPAGTAGRGNDPAGTTAAQGFAGSARTGARAETAPAGRTGAEARTTEPRSGWRRFGDPGQGARIETPRSAETPRSGWTTGGTRERTDTPRATEGSRGSWSTGGTRSGGEAPRATEPARSGGWSTGGTRERTETPRATEGSRGSWSTGGTRSGGEAPRATEPARSGGWSTGGTRERTETPRATEGSRGSWSTGGARSGGEAPRVTDPGRGSGATTGGRDRSVAPTPSEAPASTGGGQAMRGGWSTGGGRTSSPFMGSMSSPRSDAYGSRGSTWSTGGAARSEAPPPPAPPAGSAAAGPLRAAAALAACRAAVRGPDRRSAAACGARRLVPVVLSAVARCAPAVRSAAARCAPAVRLGAVGVACVAAPRGAAASAPAAAAGEAAVSNGSLDF